MGICGGREVLRETREEVAKSGEVWRESRLYFSNGVGEGEKNHLLSSFLRLIKSKFGRTPNKNSPSNWFLRRNLRFRARKSSEEKRKTPRKRWVLPQNRLKWTKKGGFGEEITGRG